MMPCALCGSDLHDRSACPWREYACSVSNQSLALALSPWLWGWQLAAGWAIAWQKAVAQTSFRIWRCATQKAGSPLLRRRISMLRLNANAPYPRQRREAAQVLQLGR